MPARNDLTRSGGDAPDRGLVVVVEDESVIADVIRRYLTAAGFGVLICRTGQDGLAAVRTDRPVAVVLDIGLPDMDGLDVCRRLRAGGDWTPVLFVTARDEDIDRILGLELGGDDYLVKPFNPRELVARARAVLRRAGVGPGPRVPPCSGPAGCGSTPVSGGSGWKPVPATIPAATIPAATIPAETARTALSGPPS